MLWEICKMQAFYIITMQSIECDVFAKHDMSLNFNLIYPKGVIH